MKTYNDFKIGIIGPGKIANKAAATIARIPGIRCYAVASRSIERAREFAKKWDIERTYGSYEDLLDDGNVDLVYVATPHSHHYHVTGRALAKGKPCLVEKAFMANSRQAEAIIELARKNKVFLAEAVWTRFQPAVGIIKDIIDRGLIGTPHLVTGTLAYSMEDKERIYKPELCGGALMDVGIYLINFLRMFFPNKIVGVSSQCLLSETGVDFSNAFSFKLEGGILANFQSSASVAGYNNAVISGSDGSIIIDNVNNPQHITVTNRDRKPLTLQEIDVPAQITGYEYEFIACKQALEKGLTEVKEMPLDETLSIMKIMDALREDWGVQYPMD